MDAPDTADRQPRILETMPSPRTILIEGLRSLRKKPAGAVTLPAYSLMREHAVLEERRIAAYARLCGFTERQGVPLTYPHMLGFPLHMRLMLDPEFPYPLVGLVHLANRITQHERLSIGQALSITARFGGWARHERGQAFTIETVATRDGAVVWDSSSTYLRLGVANPVGERVPALPAGPQPLAVKGRWRLTPGLAKRYAAISGDANPIHTSALGARLFGFRRPIIHGMWSKARSVAAMLPDAPVAQASVAVSFRTPVFLPGTVLLLATRQGETGLFDLVDGRAEKPHLRGRLQAEPA